MKKCQKIISNVVKISRKLSYFLPNPACILGVRVSSPNFKAECGRTKLYNKFGEQDCQQADLYA